MISCATLPPALRLVLHNAVNNYSLPSVHVPHTLVKSAKDEGQRAQRRPWAEARKPGKVGLSGRAVDSKDMAGTSLSRAANACYQKRVASGSHQSDQTRGLADSV